MSKWRVPQGLKVTRSRTKTKQSQRRAKVWKQTYARQPQLANTRHVLFNERIASLGFASYDEYLRSPHWQSFRRVYLAAAGWKGCHCCGEPKVELHHQSYARLGHEEPDDVIPLCRGCHERLHTLLKAGQLATLATAASDLKALGPPGHAEALAS